ncbi:MAG: hypothetical protein NVS2B8_17080 [Vulcanimicrobiaceae bacterium]
MSDDLAFVSSHIVDYRAYDEERARADSDMRVRAYLGTRLTDAQTRLAGALDVETTRALDDVLMRCMFSDQVFVRKFEHARLDAPMVAALVASDRRIIEYAQRATTVSAADLRALVIEIDKQFEYRRAPQPSL